MILRFDDLKSLVIDGLIIQIFEKLSIELMNKQTLDWLELPSYLDHFLGSY